MAYDLQITPRAADQLAQLPRKIQRQIGRRIEELGGNPRPRHSKKLAGVKELYRVRSGNYRIIYQIDDDIVTVLVIRIGHRRDVYRGLAGP